MQNGSQQHHQPQINLMNVDIKNMMQSDNPNQQQSLQVPSGQQPNTLAVPQMQIQQQVTGSFQNSIGLNPEQAAQYFQMQTKTSAQHQMNTQDTVAKIEPQFQDFNQRKGAGLGVIPEQQSANMNQAMDLLVNRTQRNQQVMKSAKDKQSEQPMAQNHPQNELAPPPGAMMFQPPIQSNMTNMPPPMSDHQNQAAHLAMPQQQIGPPVALNSISPQQQMQQMQFQQHQQQQQNSQVSVMQNQQQDGMQNQQTIMMQNNNNQQQPQQDMFMNQQQQQPFQQNQLPLPQYMGYDPSQSPQFNPSNPFNQVSPSGIPNPPSHLAPQMGQPQASQQQSFPPQMQQMFGQTPNQPGSNSVDAMELEIKQSIQQLQMYQANLIQQFNQLNVVPQMTSYSQYGGDAPPNIQINELCQSAHGGPSGDQMPQIKPAIQHQVSDGVLQIPNKSVLVQVNQPNSAPKEKNTAQSFSDAVKNNKVQLSNQQTNFQKSITDARNRNSLSLINRRQSLGKGFGMATHGTDRSQFTGISNLSQFDDQMLPSNSIISAKNTQFKMNPMQPQTRPPFVNKLEFNQYVADDDQGGAEYAEVDKMNEQDKKNRFSPGLSAALSNQLKDPTSNNKSQNQLLKQDTRGSHINSMNSGSMPMPQPQLMNFQTRKSLNDAEHMNNRLVSMQQKVPQSRFSQQHVSLNQLQFHSQLQKGQTQFSGNNPQMMLPDNDFANQQLIDNQSKHQDDGQPKQQNSTVSMTNQEQIRQQSNQDNNNKEESGSIDEERDSSSSQDESSEKKEQNIADEVIEEDDEYDGVSYLPTPQFINDKSLLAFRQSSRGGIDRVTSGNTSNIKKDSIRSGSNSGLQVPSKKRKKRKRKGESDIDGELMSKASKSQAHANQSNLYKDEKEGTQINKQWIDDLDDFLLDNEGGSIPNMDGNELSLKEKDKLSLVMQKRQSEQSRRSSKRKDDAEQLTPNSKVNEKLDRSRSNPSPNSNRSSKRKRIKLSKRINQTNETAIEKAKESQSQPRVKQKLKLPDKKASGSKVMTSEAGTSTPGLKHDKSLSSHQFNEYEKMSNKSKAQMDKELLDEQDADEEKDKVDQLKQKSPPKTPTSSSDSSSEDMVYRSQTPNIQILMSSPRIKVKNPNQRRRSIQNPIPINQIQLKSGGRRNSKEVKGVSPRHQRRDSKTSPKSSRKQKQNEESKEASNKKEANQQVQKPPSPSRSRVKQSPNESEQIITESQQNNQKKENSNNNIEMIKDVKQINDQEEFTVGQIKENKEPMSSDKPNLKTDEKMHSQTTPKAIEVSPATDTVLQTPSKSPKPAGTVVDDQSASRLKQSSSPFLSSPGPRTNETQNTPLRDEISKEVTKEVSEPKQPAADNQLQPPNQTPNLEQIQEQSQENEGTADAEKKSLIGQTIKQLNSNRLLTPGKNHMNSDKSCVIQETDFLEPPSSGAPPKRQMSTATDETSPLRQESKQTLLSGLTSHHNMRSGFGSEGGLSYANNLQNKLNSNYIANKLQMTGALSNPNLGETYEISEDIHVSQSNEWISNKMITANSNQLAAKAKEVSAQNQPHNSSEQTTQQNVAVESTNGAANYSQVNQTDEQAKVKSHRTNDIQNQTIKEQARESRNSSSEQKESGSKGEKKNSSSGEQKAKKEPKDNNNATEKGSNIKSLLQNTMSIQQQLSQFEQSSSQNKKTHDEEEKISSISSTGIVQQTERPDLKTNLSEIQEIKAKSLQKDKVLNQIIIQQQNQEKIQQLQFDAQKLKKKDTTISGYYKDSEGHDYNNALEYDQKFMMPKANATFKKKDTALRSMYSSVSTRSLQPSMNSAQLSSRQLTHHKFGGQLKAKKSQMYLRKGSIMPLDDQKIEEEQEENEQAQKQIVLQKVNRKFNILFQDKFLGHKQLLNKKIGAIQQGCLHLRQRGYFDESNDFDDIIEYTERVTFNVIKSVQEGLFNNYAVQKFNIPNLMAIEDSYLFGEENIPEVWDKTISSNYEQEHDEFNEESILRTSEANTQNTPSHHVPIKQFPSVQQSMLVHASPKRYSSMENHLNVQIPTNINTPSQNQRQPVKNRWSMADQAFQTFSPIAPIPKRSTKSVKRNKGRDLTIQQQNTPHELSGSLEYQQDNTDLMQHQEIERMHRRRQQLMFKENRKRLKRFELHRQEVMTLENQEKDLNAIRCRMKLQDLQEMKEKHKKEAEERLKKKDEERKAKHQQIKKLQKEEKVVYKSKPLYQKLEEIQQKKQKREQRSLSKKIQERKQQFKPMIQGELKEFAQQVDMIVNHLNQKKQEERDLKLQQEKAQMEDFNIAKGEQYQKVAEEQHFKRNQQVIRYQEKKELQEKKKQYSKFIKFAHLPSINSQKKEELKERITHLKHPVKEAVKIPPGTVIKYTKRPLSVNQIQRASNFNNQSAGSVQVTPASNDMQRDSQNGGEVSVGATSSFMARRQNMNSQPTLSQNRSQIQKASKVNALQLPPINTKATNRSQLHPKMWNQNTKRTPTAIGSRNQLQVISEVKKNNFLQSSSQRAFLNLRKSSPEQNQQKVKFARQVSCEPEKSKGLAHIEKYEENKFIRERESKLERINKGQAKAKDYLQEMKQNRQRKNKKSISVNSSSGANTVPATRSLGSHYNQEVFTTMRKNELSALEKLQMLAEYQKDLGASYKSLNGQLNNV